MTHEMYDRVDEAGRRFLPVALRLLIIILDRFIVRVLAELESNLDSRL